MVRDHVKWLVRQGFDRNSAHPRINQLIERAVKPDRNGDLTIKSTSRITRKTHWLSRMIIGKSGPTATRTAGRTTSKEEDHATHW